MTTTRSAAATRSDLELFLRIWDRHKLSATLARHLLRLEFTGEDRARMHELAARNQRARLSPSERQELDDYIHVGTLLSILQSRARKFLKHRNGNSRG